MSIKKFRVLWIKLRIENKRFFSIPFPIPLYIFRELLDCFLDLLTVAYFFAPKKISQAKALFLIIMKLLDSLSGDEPYDLVDVADDNCRVLIRVR